jgi:hypothetical protein
MAASSRSPAKRPFVSVKAEPRKGDIHDFTDDQVERDDFDTEARAEAQRYSKIRHDEMNRERIKTENKKRKSRGQELLPLPKKVKSRDDSSDDALDVSHRRDKQGDDFQYKGRE